MNESNQQPNIGKPSDEIDIFEFCSRMWTAFKSFLTGIKNLFVTIIIYLIRKSLWIGSFAVAGILIGFLLYGISRPFYSSFLEGNTGGVDNSAVIDHINKLDLVANKPDLLANYLGITFEQATEIRSIKAYYGIDINRDWKPDYIDLKDTYNPKDTMQLRVPSYVYIKVSVYDESVFPVLRKGLFQFIESNTYIKDLFTIDRNQKAQLMKEIELEIAKIDSLQKSQIRKEIKPDKGQTVVVGNMPEPRSFYNEILALYGRKQGIEKELEISDEIITVVQEFTPLQREERPVFIYMFIVGGAMAVMGLFCALLWQYRKTIWRLIREDATK